MPNILYVDDAESNLFVVELILEGYGVKLETANKLADGLAKVASKQYDLILLDILLPDGDGFQLITYVRNQSGHNRFVPVIAFTADVTVATRNRIIRSGFTDYIIKPFRNEDLTNRFDIYLTKKDIKIDLSYYAQFAKEPLQLEKIKEAILNDFLSFERSIFTSWQTKNYRELRQQIHRIEFVCSNLKLENFKLHFSAIRLEQGFTLKTHQAIIAVKRDLLTVYEQLKLY